MIINGVMAFAYRCANCGTIEVKDFSIFDLHDNKVSNICKCDQSQVQLKINNNKNLWIKIPCIVCDTDHIYNFSIKEILRSQVTIITCPSIGIELGFIGDKSAVIEVINRHINDVRALAKELDFI